LEIIPTRAKEKECDLRELAGKKPGSPVQKRIIGWRKRTQLYALSLDHKNVQKGPGRAKKKDSLGDVLGEKRPD